jgi:hypothetical protein
MRVDPLPGVEFCNSAGDVRNLVEQSNNLFPVVGFSNGVQMALYVVFQFKDPIWYTGSNGFPDNDDVLLIGWRHFLKRLWERG